MKYFPTKHQIRVLALGLLTCAWLGGNAQQPLRVIIVGLDHDHIHGILQEYQQGHVVITAIVETDKGLQKKYAGLYHLSDTLFTDNLRQAAIRQRPDAVLGYNAVGRHLDIVQACAPLGIPVMVEKPLAATLDQAKEIKTLADRYHIPVLTNYETTWYASYQEIFAAVAKDSVGPIKKIVAHDGHQGPREIGCSPEFLRWLTDPVLNGAGALNDFGCYGAILMTWMMKGERPLAVTAVTRHYKPDIYPKVDDDATVIVEYRQATGLIEASWNWPFSIKDLEVFGEHGYLHGLNGKTITGRLRENTVGSREAMPLAAPYNGQIPYLTAVVRHTIHPGDDLSSLAYNMIMMEILDAAKRSAVTGKRITL